MKKLVLTVMSLCLAVTMWGQTPAGSEWSPQVKQAATMGCFGIMEKILQQDFPMIECGLVLQKDHSDRMAR